MTDYVKTCRTCLLYDSPSAIDPGEEHAAHSDVTECVTLNECSPKGYILEANPPLK